MDLSRETVKHVAEVARLNLTEQEISEFLPQLKEIIGAFSELKKVDTDGTQPSFHPIALKDALGEDNPEPSLTNEEALRNSKHKKDGYFKGPRIL
jgi:aspartyl-tRNA(Asn)/glutamyl-tRNA(Gln) amidotransferase subunit C